MHKKNKFLHNKLLQRFSAKSLVIFVGLNVGLATSLAFADDYLNALEDEASQLPYLESGDGSASTVNTDKLTISEFEKFLVQKNPATASIYKKLKTASRLRVFQSYKATKDFSKAEQLIHEIYLTR